MCRAGLLMNASAVIIAHNHPSGVAEPSADDIDTTRKIAEACAVVGLRLLDHIIISADGQHTSMQQRGLMHYTAGAVKL
jgi:DNA repair protein RadC